MRESHRAISRREALAAGAGLVGAATVLGRVPGIAHADVQSTSRPNTSLPTDQIDQIMETNGSWLNGVYVIDLDRNDLNVVGPGGIPFKPAFEENHEFYFQPLTQGQALLNSELTFTEEERRPVLLAIFNNGLTLMAQHQHFIGENPQTWHYHFRGVGDPVALARAASNVVKATHTPLPQPQPSNPPTPLPKDQLAQILGGIAQVGSDGVVTVNVARPDRITLAGIPLNPFAGVQHTIAFEPLDSSGRVAACAPDYALTSPDVNPALMLSESLGFEVHCLYNQETAESPQLYFSHNIAVGDPIDLARRVRQVIDKIVATSTGGGGRG